MIGDSGLVQLLSSFRTVFDVGIVSLLSIDLEPNDLVSNRVPLYENESR